MLQLGKKLIIRKHARVCPYFHAVVSINKWSSLSRASLKSYLIMRVKWSRHGRVLPRAAVEFVHSFSFSTVHIYLRKKNGYSPGRPFFCNFVCIWPLKLNNKLVKITQYDTRYIGDFGCDWALSLNQSLECVSKKTCKLYILWRCNDEPIKQVTILSTATRCEWKSWISDSVQLLVVVQMRCADVKPLWESEREKTRFSWIIHVGVFRWLI